MDFNKICFLRNSNVIKALVANKVLGILSINQNSKSNFNVEDESALKSLLLGNHTLVEFNNNNLNYSIYTSVGLLSNSELNLLGGSHALLTSNTFLCNYHPKILPPIIINLNHLTNTNLHRFNFFNNEIDKTLLRLEDALPINYNLKSIYILLRQLKYLTLLSNEFESCSIILGIHKLHYYQSIQHKLEQYRLNYPLRVCGLAKNYQPKDINKPFLPYELIVQIFSYSGFNYAAHINFTKVTIKTYESHVSRLDLSDNKNMEVGH